MNEYVYIRSGLFTVSCNKQISCPPSRWVSQGTLVSSTNKTDRHEITDIWLKVELNTITPHNHLDLLQVSRSVT